MLYLIVFSLIVSAGAPIYPLLLLVLLLTICLTYTMTTFLLSTLLTILMATIYVGAVLVLFGYMGAISDNLNEPSSATSKILLSSMNLHSYSLIGGGLILMFTVTNLCHYTTPTEGAEFFQDLELGGKTMNLSEQMIHVFSPFLFLFLVSVMVIVLFGSSMISKNTGGHLRQVNNY